MTALLTFFLLCYTAFVVYLIIRILQKQASGITLQECNVAASIVIPFRNEEKNLPTLLNSLKKVRYNGSIELLLVNDGSTDSGPELINDLINDFSFPVRVINSVYDENIRLTSKQQALDLGIRSAKHDLIALTDADMTFDQFWLLGLITQAEKLSETALVFGHTSITNTKSPFDYFQSFQLEFLFAVAYAFHISGITGSCMGNNILISKSYYDKIGGFSKIGYSIVEDRALIAAFKRQKARISFVDPFTPTAFTYPTATFYQFTQQNLRWAVGGIAFTSNLIIPATLLTIQNISFVSTFFNHFAVMGIISITNFIMTWFFVSLVFKKIKSRVSPLYFPVYFCLFLIETLFFGFALLLKPRIVWKGRRL